MVKDQITSGQTSNQDMFDLCDLCGRRGLQKTIHAFGLRSGMDQGEADRNAVFIITETDDRFIPQRIQMVWLEQLIIEQRSIGTVQITDDKSCVCTQDFGMVTRYEAQSLRDAQVCI